MKRLAEFALIVGIVAQGDGQVHVFLLAAGKTPMTTGDVSMSLVDQYKPGPFQFVPPTNIPSHMQFALKGAHAGVTTSGSPAFEMDIANAYMIDPAHFTPVILRLHPDGDRRIIGTQTSNSNIATSTTTVDPIADDRVAIAVSTIAPGRLRITPTQLLPPGEYGVAMRDPDAEAVSYSNTGRPQNTQVMSKQQSYQAIVWDFAVRP
jgi:hypothetical protein